MQKFTAVVQVLKEAQEQIKKIFTASEDENHLLKVNSSIQKNINYLSLLNGVDDTGLVTSAPGPATTIGGKAIKYPVRVTKEDTDPDKEKVATLKQHVNELYDKFLTTETDVLLKEFDDTLIRGVAKKAGFNKVTKDNPEKITREFIVEIKEAIKKK